MAFDSIVGHERVRMVLAKALERGRLPPAMLFGGPDGVGKRSLALAVGHALLCERPTPAACGACSTCRRIAAAEAALPAMRERARKAGDPKLLNHFLHPDMVLAEPSFENVKPAIKIEQVRALVAEIGAGPFEAKRRLFVLDDAHFMTEQGANALLKCLEEPPATSHVLLVTPSPQALPRTVLSRCQTIRFGPLPAARIEVHLRTHLGLDASEAALRASASGGSLGTAVALESEAYGALREQLMSLLEKLESARPIERMDLAEHLQECDDVPAALGVLRSLLRDLAALHVGGERLLNPDLASRLAPLAGGPLGARATALAESVADTRTAVAGNANKTLAMDALVEALGAGLR